MQKLYQFVILELQLTQIRIIARIGYLSGVTCILLYIFTQTRKRRSESNCSNSPSFNFPMSIFGLYTHWQCGRAHRKTDTRD